MKKIALPTITILFLALSGCSNNSPMIEQNQNSSHGEQASSQSNLQRKIYNNDKYGFHVQLPPNWVADERGITDAPTAQNPAFIYFGSPTDVNYLTAPLDFLVLSIRRIDTEYSPNAPPSKNFPSVLEKKYGKDPGGPSYYVRADHNGMAYEFECNLLSQGNEQLCDQMLRSFEFSK